MRKLNELLKGIDVELKLLGDVSKIFSGGTPNTSKLEYYDGNIPWIRSGEVNFNVITSSARNITKEGLLGSSAKLIRKNSVVLAMTGATVGRSAVVEFETSSNQSVAAIETDENIIFYKYLYYFLENSYIEIKNAGQGALTSLNLAMIKKFKIPIPCPDNPEKSLEIQKEIVRVLDELTSLTNQLTTELETERQNRKKHFEFYREQLFNEINLIKLGDDSVGEFIRGSGLQKKDFTETGVGCIHYGQLYTHYKTFAFETKTFVSEEFAKKARKASTGDLIIATTSENDDDVCKAVAWLGNEDIAVSSDACFYRHKFNPKYVAYYFQTEQFQKQKRKYITGTKVRRVNANDLAKILIPNPPLQEQERIVKLLDEFDATHSAIEQELTNEIKLRTQQYEYYREKLLTFPEN